MAFNPLSIFSGPSPLPPQTGAVTNVLGPQQYAQGQQAFAGGQALMAGGQSLLAGGQSALEMAQRGQLTPEQQAQLDVYSKGLENTALQTYESMGINPNRSTSFISTQADIDTKTLAMAQSFIQSTIALAGTEFAAGGAELTAGTSMMGVGAQFEDAATKDLMDTARMQLQADTAYSQLIGSTLGSIGKIFAAIPGVGNLFGGGSSGGGTQTTYEGNINTLANPSFS